MLYGISGASGTGKTTLAKAVAEDLGILYQTWSITESARKHGYDPVAPMTIEQRLALQFHLLSDHVEMLGQSERPMLVDRTPIDMVAYLLGEFNMQSHLTTSQYVLDQAARYQDLCIESTERFYDFVFIVGPLDSYVPSPTRPAINPAYQAHTQLIMEGAMALTDVDQARVLTTDFEERRTIVHDQIVERMDKIQVERATSAHIH